MHVAVMREFLHIDNDTDGLEHFFDTLTIVAQPCQRLVEQVHPGVHEIAMTAAADMVVDKPHWQDIVAPLRHELTGRPTPRCMPREQLLWTKSSMELQGVPATSMEE